MEISITADSIPESDETFSVLLIAQMMGNGVIDPDRATVTIINGEYQQSSDSDKTHSA